MPQYTYTRAEKAERARLLIKGARGAYGDTTAVERRIDRIDQAAADRARREHAAHARLLDEARNALAAARVAERAAGRGERAAAREARRAAEKRLRAVERTGR
ncbi:hypothetical protein [Streptomyces sp. GSL17-111]|uniref:hypothetical protein n=1 Tax=Streptomyces sp. GSL17-111 TaxID=3121596 RepID=UPI0030F374E1